ncbi:MAG: hypothetical protein M1837_001926 [Sclerophora amabilis]|nr:MAG: hypothetical protein M1837_001926 [Sclerophora amabilis]
MDVETHFKKLAVIGCGSMGGGLALLFAENGMQVFLNDPAEETVNALLQKSKDEGLGDRLFKRENYKALCQALDRPRVLFLSLPHGTTGDVVVEGLHPYLESGDIIVDASNENWENTQRRQGKLVAQGVLYIGCGVSGGYQAARRGPSMSPGGDDKALDQVMPFFKMVAAKDSRGKPCVGKIGQGGAGHYVKMIHNGIEHGMMSSLAEAWSIMDKILDMGYDEIGDVFLSWNAEGELKENFLVAIGAQICKQKDEQGSHVLGLVQDKVVQDVDGSEGTGIWSQQEAVRLHIPAPSLSTAHYLRLASADRAQRERVKETFGGDFPIQKLSLSQAEKQAFIEDLRKAVYVGCLAAYVQGMTIIDKADREMRWGIDFRTVVQIWRAGCIIRSDHIADLLENIFNHRGDDDGVRNLLFESRVAEELKGGFASLKRIVAKAVEVNAIIPSLSATLDWLKYSGNVDLPTSFYEAELDFFGKHMFDLRSENAGEPVTGKHHFEWKPA